MFFGSFWQAFGYLNNSSNWDSIAKQADLTPEKLLDTENIVNEIKLAPQKFIAFMKEKPDFANKIVGYAINYPDQEGNDEKKLYKYPFVASEILGAQIRGLEALFFNEEEQEEEEDEDHGHKEEEEEEENEDKHKAEENENEEDQEEEKEKETLTEEASQQTSSNSSQEPPKEHTTEVTEAQQTSTETEHVEAPSAQEDAQPTAVETTTESALTQTTAIEEPQTQKTEAVAEVHTEATQQEGEVQPKVAEAEIVHSAETDQVPQVETTQASDTVSTGVVTAESVQEEIVEVKQETVPAVVEQTEVSNHSSEVPAQEAVQTQETEVKSESTNKSSEEQTEEKDSNEQKSEKVTQEEKPKKKNKSFGKELLEKLLSFIDTNEVLNDTNAGYFYKAVNNILSSNGFLLKFIVEKQEYVSLLVRHIRTKSISEVILKMLTSQTNEATDPYTELKKNLLTEVLLKFQNGDEVERENISHIIYEVIQFLLGADIKIKACGLQKIIQEDSTISALFSVVNQEKIDNSSLGFASAALGVIVTYYNSKIRSQKNPQAVQDEDEICNVEEEKLQFPGESIFVKNIPNLVQILKSQPLNQESNVTSFGETVVPLGVGRLKIVELIGHIFKSENRQLIDELANENIFQVLLNLMIQYPWNNLLHVAIDKVVQEGLTEVNNDTSESVRNALIGEKFNLLQFIAENSKKDKITPGTIKKEMRIGYIGFLTGFARKIQQASLSFQLTALKATDYWKEYLSTKLKEITTTEEINLGGDNPNKRQEEDDQSNNNNKFEIDIQKIYEKFNNYFKVNKDTSDDQQEEEEVEDSSKEQVQEEIHEDAEEGEGKHSEGNEKEGKSQEKEAEAHHEQEEESVEEQIVIETSTNELNSSGSATEVKKQEASTEQFSEAKEASSVENAVENAPPAQQEVIEEEIIQEVVFDASTEKQPEILEEIKDENKVNTLLKEQEHAQPEGQIIEKLLDEL